jgi:uncharacterized SAM-binding protein YcdF (DUF218 family)
MKKLLLLLAGALAVLAAIDVAYRFAAFNTMPARLGGCAVLVLGYPTEDDGALSPLQRVRVESGVTAYRGRQCKRIVFSGGAVSNQYIEAESMANFARALGVPDHDIVIEAQARNTWENVGCSLPYLQSYDSILIASEILHAKRAKRYLCRQQPSLCTQAEPIGNALPRGFRWKVSAAMHELGAWIRDLLLYEGGAVDNAPACPSGPRR